MKLASIFFTVSAQNLRVYLKDTNNWVRYTTFALIFYSNGSKKNEIIPMIPQNYRQSEYERLNSKEFADVCSLLYEALNFTLWIFSPAPRLKPSKEFFVADNSRPVR